MVTACALPNIEHKSTETTLSAILLARIVTSTLEPSPVEVTKDATKEIETTRT